MNPQLYAWVQCVEGTKLKQLRLFFFRLFLHGSSAEKFCLLLRRLESAMTHFRRSIDELQCDLLSRPARHLWQQRLAQCHYAFARAANSALEHDPVLGDFSIMRKAAHRCDSLLGEIVFSHGTMGIILNRLPNTVNFFVDLRTVVVTSLTRPRNLELQTRRVPCAN